MCVLTDNLPEAKLAENDLRNFAARGRFCGQIEMPQLPAAGMAPTKIAIRRAFRGKNGWNGAPVLEFMF